LWSCFLLTDAVLAGTRRKVKVEKIPLLSTDSCADSLKATQTKENVCPSAETVETQSSVDDSRNTGCDAQLPSISSVSAHSKKPSQSENTQAQNMVQIDTPQVEKDGLSGLGGERQGPVCERHSAAMEEKSSSSTNPEAENSCAELVANPNEPQVNSVSTSKAVTNTAMQIEHKSHVSVESVATAERQSHDRIKPKLLNVRRTTDGPDQNCKTQ